MSDRGWTVVILLAVVALVGAWDVYVAFFNREKDDTVSEVVRELARRHPLVPFLFGLLMGHFFW